MNTQNQQHTDIYGTIENVQTYKGGWAIIGIDNPKFRRVTGVINADSMRVGDFCRFTGYESVHHTYGPQFKAVHIVTTEPRGERAVKKYLAYQFKGIGEKTAESLYSKFGDNLWDVISESPEKLVTIRGISPNKAAVIHTEYLAKKDKQADELFFIENGISSKRRESIREHYSDIIGAEFTDKQIIELLKSDPYDLIDNVWGIGFKTADRIAMFVGLLKNDPQRIRAGILHTLNCAENEGHTCLPESSFRDSVSKILEIGAENEAIDRQVARQLEFGKIVRDAGHIYPQDLHACEKSVALKLRELGSHDFIPVPIQSFEKTDFHRLDESQKKAVRTALGSRLSVITGGPGVGKTFTINVILQALGKDSHVALAAPTGKAAKRMEQATGQPAQTIHRLLEYSNYLKGFQRCEESPMEYDFIIIDESSMIDIRLAYSLISAIGKKTNVIFVGDRDQLPSVGPGKFFAGIIESDLFPVSVLTKNHRQGKGSMIAQNASFINEGKPMIFTNCVGEEIRFLNVGDSVKAQEKVSEVISKIPERYGIPLEDVQVLAPQKNGAIGTHELNRIAGKLINPNGDPIKSSDFRIGDRVIHIKNNYKLGVFNGDIGIIVGAESDGSRIAVNYDDQFVEYDKEQMTELRLAYALTVHKSQGSEFRAVVIPVHDSHWFMLNRNLLYTAVSRARELLVIVGTEKAIGKAINTIDAKKRHTNLVAFLRKR